MPGSSQLGALLQMGMLPGVQQAALQQMPGGLPPYPGFMASISSHATLPALTSCTTTPRCNSCQSSLGSLGGRKQESWESRHCNSKRLEVTMTFPASTAHCWLHHWPKILHEDCTFSHTTQQFKSSSGQPNLQGDLRARSCRTNHGCDVDDSSMLCRPVGTTRPAAVRPAAGGRERWAGRSLWRLSWRPTDGSVPRNATPRARPFAACRGWLAPPSAAAGKPLHIRSTLGACISLYSS